MLVSRRYSPSATLSPFISNHVVLSATFPVGHELVDLLFAESSFIWIVRNGDLAVELLPGVWRAVPHFMFHGPLSRAKRLRVRGPFDIVALGFRPSGWRALFDRSAAEFVDGMLTLTDIWGQGGNNLRQIALEGSDNHEIMRAIEDEIVRRLNRIGSWQADQAMRGFERIAWTDSTRQVKDLAAELGLSPRQFERHSRLSYGFSPKQVLRRNRFFDMATVLRGIADRSERQLAELRYFDQSHRNREFRQFIAMTPQQFAQTPTPLFDLGLRTRLLLKAATSPA